MFKFLLFPFSILYNVITYVRNTFYNIGILKSTSFKKPIIVVGNLCVGGTGKSPFVIELINLFKNKYKIGFLSRGYGRETKGFLFANHQSNYKEIGDEPMQCFERFKYKIALGVDNRRVRGIKKMDEIFSTDFYILDDAFQHRSLKAGMYILLTSYEKLYCDDYLLPFGRLREGRYAAERASIVVVTKCPENIKDNEKEKIRDKLKVKSGQYLFFSTIAYDSYVKSIEMTIPIVEIKDSSILLVTGIADYKQILDFCKTTFKDVIHLKFKDHYNYKREDINKISKKFNEISSDVDNKYIITTEKDFMRLKIYRKFAENVFYLPIKIKIDNEEKLYKIVNDYICG